jgi:hypothetical protein
MNKMAMAGMLSLLCAAPAVAVPIGPYSVQEDVPETGSNITKRTVFWPIPVDKRYEELTSEERQVVRDEYVRLGARDEPPYPREGMTPILSEVARIQRTNRGPGLLHLAVRVDARGEPQGVAILSTPDVPIAHGVSYALMKTRYKPAMCDGAPCAGDYSFKYKVPVGYTHNFIADWNTSMWMVPLKKD